MSEKVTTSKNMTRVGLNDEEKQKHTAAIHRLEREQAQLAQAPNHKPDPALELVLIRADRTLTPPPRVGNYLFAEVYDHFREGVLYKCPRYVAMALEEGRNAVIVQGGSGSPVALTIDEQAQVGVQ